MSGYWKDQRATEEAFLPGLSESINHINIRVSSLEGNSYRYNAAVKGDGFIPP